jgi:hypothetical protein
MRFVDCEHVCSPRGIRFLGFPTLDAIDEGSSVGFTPYQQMLRL